MVSVKEQQGQGPHILKTQQFHFIVVEIMQILLFKGDLTFNLISCGPRQGLWPQHKMGVEPIRYRCKQSGGVASNHKGGKEGQEVPDQIKGKQRT